MIRAKINENVNSMHIRTAIAIYWDGDSSPFLIRETQEKG
jgi:hypothetical protein